MTDLTRREAIAASAVAGAFAAMPAFAQAPAAAAGGAQWDLTELYPSDAAFEAARKALIAQIPSIGQYKGHLADSAEALSAALSLASDLGRTFGRLATYASLNADADTANAAAQERNAQIDDTGAQFGEATAWIEPELLAIPRQKLTAFLAASPVLKSRFDFYLADVIRRAEHTLPAEQEALLAGTGPAFGATGDVRQQLVSTNIPWPGVTLSTGKVVQRLDDQQYTLNRDAPNRADRKLVFDTFWGEYGKFKESLGAAYAGHIKGDIFYKKARKYPTSLANALARNNVPEAVYRTLVAETNAGLPQLHRYFELRRRLLKLPDMAYYDIYPPLVQLDRPLTLPQMRATVLEAVKPLGPDYVAMLAKATAAKWMDPLPRAHKRSGAYMNPGAYDVHPYLLLNLGPNYEGMSTFAHEWGHAMHTLLANKTQPYDKSDYPIFLAEIASTLNEQLLVEYMLKQATTREEKLFYLGQRLEGIRGTFYRQAMFAEFELAAHDRAEAGEGLSGDKFTSMYLDLLRRYHGPKVAVSDVYGSEWAYIPHFYNSFYVYQYATCVSAAVYFTHAILTGGVKERDNYLGVLRAGGSDYPTEILKRAGLDMASPAPYRAIVESFKATLDEAETLMG